MTARIPEKERVLVVIDPVSCGGSAVERALAELDAHRHETTLAVVAKAPTGSGDGGSNESPDFAYADSVLTSHLHSAQAAGFVADGWVVPDRRQQMMREIEATGPYSRALAVSPSGTWRRLVKRDVSRLLETAGVETALHCEPTGGDR